MQREMFAMICQYVAPPPVPDRLLTAGPQPGPTPDLAVLRVRVPGLDRPGAPGDVVHLQVTTDARRPRAGDPREPAWRDVGLVAWGQWPACLQVGDPHKS